MLCPQCLKAQTAAALGLHSKPTPSLGSSRLQRGKTLGVRGCEYQRKKTCCLTRMEPSWPWCRWNCTMASKGKSQITSLFRTKKGSAVSQSKSRARARGPAGGNEEATIILRVWAPGTRLSNLHPSLILPFPGPKPSPRDLPVSPDLSPEAPLRGTWRFGFLAGREKRPCQFPLIGVRSRDQGKGPKVSASPFAPELSFPSPTPETCNSRPESRGPRRPGGQNSAGRQAGSAEGTDVPDLQSLASPTTYQDPDPGLTAARASTWCSKIGLLQKSTSGFGMLSVSGRRRVP